MTKKAIIIFTRIPVPGKTKTRLMPYFNGKQCSALHYCFLKDIYASCIQTGADLFVAYTGEKNVPSEFKNVFGREVNYFVQRGSDLGERMYHAFQNVFEKGYENVLLVGSDIPELCSTHLNQAFQCLRTSDTVFGSAADGGYYLVGMKQARWEVFEGQTFSHAHVLEETIHRLKMEGVSTATIGILHDLDTKEDVRKYRIRMRKNKRLQQTHTGKFLMRNVRISVIVPVYNEETTINAIQRQLLTYRKKCEIIFVDGGSTDKTLEMIMPEFQVFQSQKGRANQMNLGAKMSHGDILFFLHCDSELPDDFLKEIKQVAKDFSVGCFGIAFHSKAFFLWTCRVISNHRVKDRKVIFGDQGIFIDRDLFFDIGMYPAIPIMEDYQLSLNLKKRRVPLGMTKHRIYTSSRRFPKGTWAMLAVMWKMNRLRKYYREGMDIEVLARAYKDIR